MTAVQRFAFSHRLGLGSRCLAPSRHQPTLQCESTDDYWLREQRTLQALLSSENIPAEIIYIPKGNMYILFLHQF